MKYSMLIGGQSLTRADPQHVPEAPATAESAAAHCAWNLPSSFWHALAAESLPAPAPVVSLLLLLLLLLLLVLSLSAGFTAVFIVD